MKVYNHCMNSPEEQQPYQPPNRVAALLREIERQKERMGATQEKNEDPEPSPYEALEQSRDSQMMEQIQEEITKVGQKIATLQKENEHLGKINMLQKEKIGLLHEENGLIQDSSTRSKYVLLDQIITTRKWIITAAAASVLALGNFVFWASEHSEHGKTQQRLNLKQDENHALLSRIIFDQDARQEKDLPAEALSRDHRSLRQPSMRK